MHVVKQESSVVMFQLLQCEYFHHKVKSLRPQRHLCDVVAEVQGFRPYFLQVVPKMK